MKAIIRPSRRINSAYLIQPSALLKLGYRGIIVDVDNTLLAWNETEPSQVMIEWVKRMQGAGLKVFLLSNNRQARVAKLAAPLKLAYSASSLKPSRRGFKRGIKALDLPSEQIVVIGDQLLTDILGANLSSLDSILVKPLARHDIIYTWPNRWLEKLIYAYLKIDKQSDWGNTLA